MADHSLGKVMLISKGTYSAAVEYNRLDFVEHQGSSYVGLHDSIINKTPGENPDDWQLLAAGISISNQVQNYAAQTEEEYTGEPPSTGWQSTVPTGTAKGYIWTRITTTYSDGSTKATYTAARNGSDGNGQVETVNEQTPDEDGNISLDAGNINVDDSAEEPETVEEAISSLSSQKANQSIISDTWTSRTWNKGEYCIDNNKLWKCKVANSSAPSEGANWTEVQITDLIKDLNDFVTSSELTEISNTGIKYKKTGNLVTLYVYKTGFTFTAANTYQEFYNALPAEIRPPTAIYNASSTHVGNKIGYRISTDGVISVTCDAVATNKAIIFTVTYLI